MRENLRAVFAAKVPEASHEGWPGVKCCNLNAPCTPDDFLCAATMQTLVEMILTAGASRRTLPKRVHAPASEALPPGARQVSENLALRSPADRF